MKQAVIVMYDAPSTPELDEWMHGPHYDEVLATPGVTGVERFEVIEGPGGARKYVAVIHTEDLQATVAWRDSKEGQLSQNEANDRGVANRYGLICKTVFSAFK